MKALIRVSISFFLSIIFLFSTNVYAAAPIADLAWAIRFDVWSLDPIASSDLNTRTVTYQIFEGLTTFSPDGEVVPALAESFERIDPVTWEFRLRQGIVFHDGEPFNAYAVKASLERSTNPLINFSTLHILDMIRDISMVDEYTIRIRTFEPFSPLPAHLTHSAAFIVSPLAIKEETYGGRNIEENPIGTGPFILWERVFGEHFLLIGNENYWQGTPKVDTLKLRVVHHNELRLALLEAGIVNGMQVSTEDLSIINDMPHVEITNILSNNTNYLGFNTQRGILSDVRVRQAISMAINREEILEALAVYGQLATGPLSPNNIFKAHDLEPLPFDLDKARQLMAEAGYGEIPQFSAWRRLMGDTAENNTLELFVNGENQVRLTIAEMVQSNLAKIGIDVIIYAVDWGAFLDFTSMGEHDMFILGSGSITGDADDEMAFLFYSGNIGAGNRTFYDNPQVDMLIHQGRITDAALRAEVYREITEILINDAPMVFLYHAYMHMAMIGIEGVEFDFNGVPRFFNASIC